MQKIHLELSTDDLLNLERALSDARSYRFWSARSKKFIPNYSMMKQMGMETENNTILSDQDDYQSTRSHMKGEEYSKLADQIELMTREQMKLNWEEELKKMQEGKNT